MTTQSFDVLCIGRVGVDLYPMDTGVGLEEVRTFGKFLGGSATNVAVAAARYGHTSAIITRTGDDPFGGSSNGPARARRDTEFVGIDPTLPTPVTFCELFPPDTLPALLLPLPPGARPADRPRADPPVAVARAKSSGPP
jgi:5-dehydro-2-deoxygluconokinase